MSRTIIAALVGGLVVFAWGAFSHVVLPLGEAGILSLPSEDKVLPAMKEAIREPGLYFFPGMETGRAPTPEEQQAWEARYTAGPTGILVYHPGGEPPMSPRQLLTELGSNLAAALLAALGLGLLPGPGWRRVACVALMGVFGWLSISVSQWNWYRFPTTFMLAEGLDQTVSWLLAGLAMSAIVRPASPADRG